MLSQSYADLVARDPIYWEEEENNWIEFDHDAFGNIESVGAGRIPIFQVGVLNL
jgi:hypothetical protein